MPARYGQPEYWDERYRKCLDSRGELQEYDWYVGWEAVRGVVSAYLQDDGSDKILVVGCGNSAVSKGLYDMGHTNVTSIDSSTFLIRKLREKHEGVEGMRHYVMDVRAMEEFGDESFDLVIDKGCLDSLSCSYQGIEAVGNMLNEICRVLKTGGNFVEISYGAPAVRRPLLEVDHLVWAVRHMGLGVHHFYIMRKTEEAKEKARQRALEKQREEEEKQRKFHETFRLVAPKDEETEDERRKAQEAAAAKAFEEKMKRKEKQEERNRRRTLLRRGILDQGKTAAVAAKMKGAGANR